MTASQGSASITASQGSASMTASQGSASITAKQVTTSFKITVNKLSRGEIYVANFINPKNAPSLSSF